ncbi:hypothetical protein P5673_026100, partial [Acropora cervicornis]
MVELSQGERRGHQTNNNWPRSKWRAEQGGGIDVIVPQTGMSFKEVQFMTPLPCEGLSKKDEEIMKEWLENYRPVRQRTVRSERTKDKAGALPPAAYAKPKPDVTAKINPLVSDVLFSFISDSNIPQVKLASAVDFNQVEEYELKAILKSARLIRIVTQRILSLLLQHARLKNKRVGNNGLGVTLIIN